MLPEKPYLRQIGLLEVGKFAKKPYFSQFYRRSKRAAPIGFISIPIAVLLGVIS
jgi:hypothetical protein